jgi:hypothetical protein
MAAQVLLRRNGHPADLRFGVRRSERKLEAHAWVESRGRVVIGRGQLTRFTPLSPTRSEGGMKTEAIA